MIHARPRLRVLVLATAALVAAAAFAAVGGATTAATAPTPTAAPLISGTLQVGQTLSTTSGSWNGSTPMTFTYQWERCSSSGNSCSDISGETQPTYKLQSADANHTMRSRVTAQNSAGTGTVESNHTNVVGSVTPPANTALPTISGSPVVGATLTASNGTWEGTAPITYAYQWLRCNSSGSNCSSHSKGTNQTLTVVSGDLNNTIRVRVTATNGGGSAQAQSAQTAVITAATLTNTAAPVLSGTPKQGETLSVTTGTWTGTAPITYTYAWQHCDSKGNNCGQINGATAQTYVAQATDVDKYIRVQVTAKNGVGATSSALSNLLGPVASPLPPGAVKLPDGEISVPASTVTDANQLLIVSVKYSPAAIHGKSPVSLTVKVIEQNKYVVSGALVYVLPVPSSWGAKTAEVQTGQDGKAVVTVTPTTKAPARGSLVLFVRARTPQGNLLAGSSTRRLTQVRIFAH